MTDGYCPECDSDLKIRKPTEGMLITCPKCGAYLEIVNTSPLELDWAYDEVFEDDDTDADDY